MGILYLYCDDAHLPVGPGSTDHRPDTDRGLCHVDRTTSPPPIPEVPIVHVDSKICAFDSAMPLLLMQVKGDKKMWHK